MPALIIIGSVLLVIIILLMTPVRANVVYEKDVTATIKYMFFTVMRIPETDKMKAKRKRKEKRKKERDEKKHRKALKKRQKSRKNQLNKIPAKTANQTQQQPQTSQSEKGTATSREAEAKKEEEDSVELFDKLKQSFDLKQLRELSASAKKPVKHLFQKIKIYDVYIDIVVGGEDAAQVGLRYGRYNMYINGTLCWLKSIMNVKTEEVNIEADFMREETDAFAYFNIKAKLGTIILCILWFFIKSLKKSINGAKSTVDHKVSQVSKA